MNCEKPLKLFFKLSVEHEIDDIPGDVGKGVAVASEKQNFSLTCFLFSNFFQKSSKLYQLCAKLDSNKVIKGVHTVNGMKGIFILTNIKKPKKNEIHVIKLLVSQDCVWLVPSLC